MKVRKYHGCFFIIISLLLLSLGSYQSPTIAKAVDRSSDKIVWAQILKSITVVLVYLQIWTMNATNMLHLFIETVKEMVSQT